VFQSEAGGPFNAVAATSGTSYDAPNLLPLTQYCFTLASYADGAMSAQSAPVCATTFDMTGGLSAPTGVTAMGTSPSRITVAWNAVTGATTYNVYQSEGGGPFSVVGAVTAPTTSFDSAGLTAATQYCYQVQAASTAGMSALSSPPVCAMPLASGSSARWKMDNNANDSSGFGFNGALAGGASFTTTDKAPLIDETGHNPAALSIPGGASDSVSVPSAGAFAFNDDFSISLWVKVTSGSTLRLIGKREAGCGAVDWEFGQSGGNLYFASGTGTATFSAGLPSNTWTQVAVTNGGGVLSLYVNGSAVESDSYAISTDNTAPLEIGNSGGCGSSAAFLLDEVRLYARQLSGAEVSVLGTAPATPINITATGVTSTRIDITWDAVAGADQYIVYKGTSPGNLTYLTSMPATTSTYIEGHAVSGETTYWQVRSVNDGLLSGFSAEVSAAALGPPPAPTGVMATAASASQIDISWTAESRAFVYYIYMSQGGGPYQVIGAVSAPTTTFTAANLSSMTAYSFVVTTMDSGYTEGPQSTPAGATTL
jgi:fibronectin type 3 domain-containing protein